jgi:hypothetical protein
MLPAVNFHNKHSLQTDKIENIILEWMLPPEFISAHLTAPQATPQTKFCVGHVTTQLALRFISQHPLVCLAFHLPIPIPAFPLKGKERTASDPKA